MESLNLKGQKGTLFVLLLLMFVTLALAGCQSAKITGVIALPEGEKAFEDMKINVACVRASDEIPEEQIVVLPKGQSEIAFQLKAPKKDKAYFFRYLLLSKGGEGTKEGLGMTTANESSNLTIGGLSIANHAYAKEGYLTESGMTTQYEEKTLFKDGMLDQHRLTIPLEAGIKEKTAEILSDIINPEMNDYEKEKAIYDYVVLNVPLAMETTQGYMRGTLVEKDNPLISALRDRETVWLGQPFLMKWLLQSAGIESELVEARQDSFNFTYVYNLVKIDNAHYYVDPAMSSVMIHEKMMHAGEHVFVDPNEAVDHFKNRHFNFTDDFNKNRGLTLFGENGTPQAATDVNGFALVKSYLEKNKLDNKQLDNNQLDKKMTNVVNISLELPKGVEAPKGGLWILLTAKSGQITDATKDDFVLDQWIVIPKGKDTFEISLPLVETNQPFTITASEPRTKMRGQISLKQISNIQESVKLKLN